MLRAAILLLCIGALTAQFKKRFEFENVLSGKGTRRIPWRSGASNLASLHMFKGDIIVVNLCLPEATSVTVNDLIYSNDGESDRLEVFLDNASIGIVNTEANSGGFGRFWDIFKSSGQVAVSQELVPGKHNLSISIPSADCYGSEFDALEISLNVNVSEEQVWCDFELIYAKNPTPCAVEIDSPLTTTTYTPPTVLNSQSTLEQTSSERTTSAQTTSAQTTSDRTTIPPTSSEKTTSERTLSAQTNSERTTSSAQTTSERTTSAQTTSQQTNLQLTTSDRKTSEQITSAQTTSKRITLSPTTSERTISERTSSAQTTSERTKLPTTSSERTSSERTTSAQTTSELTTILPTSERTSSAQATSERTTSFQTTSERTILLPTTSNRTTLAQTTLERTRFPPTSSERTTSKRTTSAQTTSAQATSKRITLSPTTSERTITERTSSAQTTSERTKLPTTSSERTSSERTTLAQTTSELTTILPTSERTSSAQATSERTTSFQTTSERTILLPTTSNRTTLAQTTLERTRFPPTSSERTTSKRTTSAQTTSLQTASPQSTSERTFSPQTTLPKKTSSQTTAEQTTPAQTTSAISSPQTNSLTPTTSIRISTKSLVTQSLTTSAPITSSTTEVATEQTTTPNPVPCQQLSYETLCIDKTNVNIMFNPSVFRNTKIIAREVLEEIPKRQRTRGGGRVPGDKNENKDRGNRRSKRSTTGLVCDNSIWIIGVPDEGNKELGPLSKLSNINYLVDGKKDHSTFPGTIDPRVTNEILIKYKIPRTYNIKRGKIDFTLGLVNISDSVSIGLHYYNRAKKMPSDVEFMTFHPTTLTQEWLFPARAVSPSLQNELKLVTDQSSTTPFKIDFLQLRYQKRDWPTTNTLLSSTPNVRVRGRRYRHRPGKPWPEHHGMGVTVDGSSKSDRFKKIMIYKLPYSLLFTVFDNGEIFVNHETRRGRRQNMVNRNKDRISDVSGFTLGRKEHHITLLNIDTSKNEVHVTLEEGKYAKFHLSYTKTETTLTVLDTNMDSGPLSFFSTYISHASSAVTHMMIDGGTTLPVMDPLVNNTFGKSFTFLKNNDDNKFDVNDNLEFVFP
ncbi:uncharacterized protein LOC128221220 [Mya arenaria]|uniref:uncharacterized protein LOC128221220 n=1 Tax=Mya arenaria TaxID=6604 RepID=UPI0022E56718|nr:uncharacterized protein LOC128221220 [Mya arenaria]